MPKVYLWPRLGKGQDPAVLSMHIYGAEDRLNWMPLLCLGHGLLGPGKSVQGGAQMKRNPLSTPWAGPYRYQPLTDIHASCAPFVHKYNKHWSLDDTDPNVIFYTGDTVELAVSPDWGFLQTENPKSPSFGLVLNN